MLTHGQNPVMSSMPHSGEHVVLLLFNLLDLPRRCLDAVWSSWCIRCDTIVRGNAPARTGRASRTRTQNTLAFKISICCCVGFLGLAFSASMVCSTRRRERGECNVLDLKQGLLFDVKMPAHKCTTKCVPAVHIGKDVVIQKGDGRGGALEMLFPGHCSSCDLHSWDVEEGGELNGFHAFPHQFSPGLAKKPCFKISGDLTPERLAKMHQGVWKCQINQGS